MLYNDYRNKFGIGQSVTQPPPAVPPVKNYVRGARPVFQPEPVMPSPYKALNRTGFSTGIPGAMQRPVAPAPQTALVPPPVAQQVQPIPTPALPSVSPSTAATGPVRTAIPTSFPVDPNGSNKVSQERIQDYATRDGGGYLSAGKGQFGTIDPSGSVITNGLGNGAASGISSNVPGYDERAEFQKNFGGVSALPDAPKDRQIDRPTYKQAMRDAESARPYFISEQKQLDHDTLNIHAGNLKAYEDQLQNRAIEQGNERNANALMYNNNQTNATQRYQSALQAPMWAGEGALRQAEAKGVPEGMKLKADEVRQRREELQGNKEISRETLASNKELAVQTQVEKTIGEYASRIMQTNPSTDPNEAYAMAFEAYHNKKAGLKYRKKVDMKPGGWFSKDTPAIEPGWYKG